MGVGEGMSCGVHERQGHGVRPAISPALRGLWIDRFNGVCLCVCV